MKDNLFSNLRKAALASGLAATIATGAGADASAGVSDVPAPVSHDDSTVS